MYKTKYVLVQEDNIGSVDHQPVVELSHSVGCCGCLLLFNLSLVRINHIEAGQHLCVVRTKQKSDRC